MTRVGAPTEESDMYNVHLRQSWCKVSLAALLALGTIPAAGLSAIGQAWAAETEVAPAAVTATTEGPEAAIGAAQPTAGVTEQTPADAAAPRDAAAEDADPAQPQAPALPALASGWNYLDGQWYYGRADGTPQTGWLYDGAWYYLHPDTGAMATYWTQVDGTWYYLGGSGAMETGWQHLSGAWYYLYGSGAMATGWQWIDGAWYYLYPDTGAMATGWLQLGDSWYYLRGSGAMATGGVTIGSEYHQFDGSGVWQGSTDLAGMFTAWAQPEWSATNWLILVDTARCKVAVFWGSQWNWQLQYLWDCAPGKASTPTVKGRFSVGSRGYYFDSKNARCFYYTQFYGNYLFHSVLYHQTSSPTWIMDGRLGIPLSHGCVRLDVWNAQWIYNNIPGNTRVYIW